MRKCTIIVQDEVNCRIAELELSTRKKLVNKFKFINQALRYTPAVKLGRWDGSIQFFSMGGSTYINLLPEILPILEEEGYEIELDDRRDYRNNYPLDPVTENSFAHAVWPKGHPKEGEPIALRDYQVSVINDFLQNPQAIGAIATGAGKTIISAALSQRCERWGRTIIIVPNTSLVNQTEKDYKALGLDVGVFYGGRKEFGKTHTICTWQSLSIMQKNTRNQEAIIPIGEFIEDVVCIMVDEAHSVKGEQLKQLLTGPMSKIPIRWGLTGTIPKEDFNRVTLTTSLGPVISTLTASDLQEKGVLANCHINIIQMVDHVEFKDYQQELKYLLENDARQEELARVISKIAESGNTLVLIDRVNPGKSLASLIPDAVFLSGGTKAKDRELEYEGFTTSDNKVAIATYGIAAVGINIVRVHNLVLIEPGKSFVRVIQSIGRGLRKGFDKEEVQIYDITSTCKFAKRHLSKRKAYYNEARYPNSTEKLNWKA